MTTHLELVEQNNFEMYAAIKRVRELHKPDENGYCLECRVKTMTDRKTMYALTMYPCQTIKALDGEQ